MRETHGRIDSAYLTFGELKKALNRLKKFRDMYVIVDEMSISDMYERNKARCRDLGLRPHRMPTEYKINEPVYFVQLYSPLNLAIVANRLEKQVQELTALLKDQT